MGEPAGKTDLRDVMKTGTLHPTATPSPRIWQRIAIVVALSVLFISVFDRLVKLSLPASAELSDALIQELANPSADAIDETRWQRITLPDPLCRRTCAYPYKAYRLQFAAEHLSIDHLLYVPLYDSAFEIYLNGQPLGTSGRMTAPVSAGGYRPIAFQIPATRLQASNTLDFILVGFARGGHALGPLYVAPAEQLNSTFRLARFLTLEATALSVGVVVLLIAMALLIYLRVERNTLYIWFAATLACAALRFALRLSPDWPVGFELRMSLYFVATFGVLLCATLFVRRLLNLSRSDIETAVTMLVVLTVMMIVVNLHTTESLLFAWQHGVRLSQVLALAVAPYQIWLLARRLGGLAEGLFWPLAILLVLSICLVLNDVLVSTLNPPLILPLSNLGLIPLMLAFALILAERFANARRAVPDERARIMQDMHDGVGGELSTLLARANQGDVDPQVYATALQKSVNDLRFIIDSLDTEHSRDVRTALGAFRARVDPLLTAQGFRLEWRNEVPHNFALSPETLLGVYRIMQEVVSNAIRHSGGTHLHIGARAEQETLVIDIFDDGNGNVVPSAGRGLANIHKRAVHIGATLARVSGPGTHWRLQVTPENSG